MWAWRNVMKASQSQIQRKETSPAALDQDPKKHGCLIKNNTNQVHHSPYFEHSVWIHQISAYLTMLHRELVSRGKTCVSLISHQQPLQIFLLCFIAKDEPKIDWRSGWKLNVSFKHNNECRAETHSVWSAMYLISVTSLVKEWSALDMILTSFGWSTSGDLNQNKINYWKVCLINVLAFSGLLSGGKLFRDVVHDKSHMGAMYLMKKKHSADEKPWYYLLPVLGILWSIPRGP